MANEETFVSYLTHSSSVNECSHILQNPVVDHGSVNSSYKTQLIEEVPLMSKQRIIWNLFVLSFSYLMFQTGFWGLTNLQSTMNAAGGMGPDSQAVIYAASMISSLFLPEITIENFGCKRVLIFTTILGLPYLASNMYLRWDVLLSMSTLFGLISGPYNGALTVYIDELAIRYQALTKQDLEFVVAVFFGVYSCFMEGTQIFGNAISFIVISERHVIPRNLTDNNTLPLKCGIDFDAHGNVTNSNLEVPPEHERIVLVCTYVGMGLFSVLLLCCFLDPLKNDIKEGSGWKSACHRFLAAIKHVGNPHQILLIPITILIGIESALYSNEFTEAYIACSWGVHHVGFVTICFGVCGAIMSLLVGPLVKYISQMAVLILAACANIGICVLLFLWDPTPETTSIYFIIAGVWGMGDAIWWSQISALYGLMFPNDREAAFSNLYFWSFLGFFLSYSYANYLSVAVKINILMAFLLTGMACYLVGQIKIKCSARKEYIHIENGNQ
ncbi:protein unc-93 homolog A isoform X1 [Parasteatoda tepidariorum]|uniref:protein unc-93 homolog A isoform X1 n=1 Tax=Parasteatoda tepidariorum TaxID=114398 RepID=UPI00077FB8D8|nr:protein unc-93 homolog A isoform X1 [Parasteatoda tepidariorum]